MRQTRYAFSPFHFLRSSFLLVLLLWSCTVHAISMSWPSSIAQNTDALIEWDGKAPFDLVMKQRVGGGIKVLDSVQGLTSTSFNWKVTAPSGSTVFFTLNDASPNSVDSADLPVQPDPAVAASSRIAASAASVSSAAAASSAAAQASASILQQSAIISSLAAAQSSQMAAQSSLLNGQSRMVQPTLTVTDVAPDVTETSLPEQTNQTVLPTSTSLPSTTQSNTRTRTLIIVISSVCGAVILILAAALFIWCRKVRQPIHPRRAVTGYENSNDDLEKSLNSMSTSRSGHSAKSSVGSDSTVVSITSPARTYKSPARSPSSQPPSTAWVRNEAFRPTVTDRERDQDPRYMGRLTRTYNDLVDALASTPAPPPLPSPSSPTGTSRTERTRASLYRSFSLRSKQSAVSGKSIMSIPRTLTDYESEGSHYPPTTEEAQSYMPMDIPTRVMSPTLPLRIERKRLTVVN